MEVETSTGKLIQESVAPSPTSRHDETKESTPAQSIRDTEDKNDDGYSTAGSSDDDAIGTASLLTSEKLFRAHTRKLNRERDYDDSTSTKHKKGIHLVDSLVDYVQGLESRIKNLESMLGSKKSNTEDYRDRSIPADTELGIHFFHVENELLPNDIEIVGIRIDSRPLVKGFPVIEFYRPYRTIIRNLKYLHEHIAELESSQSIDEDAINKKQIEQQENDDPSGLKHHIDNQSPRKTTDMPELKNAHFGTATALSHFRAFVDFIQKYLEQQLNIYESIRKRSCLHVSFENIWMLFNSKETIYCPGKRERQEIRLSMKKTSIYTKNTDWPQAFRIYATSGGIGVGPAYKSQFHDTQAQDQSDRGVRESFCPLIVSCYSVQFDAERYGPVQDFFVFKPFEGQVDITRLEAYPIQFHRHGDGIVQRLLDRGRKFIDISIVSHMNYNGLTLGDSKEEVYTKLAFHENVRRPPIIGALPGDLPGAALRQTIEVAVLGRCEHRFPCYNWSCMWEGYNVPGDLQSINLFLKRNLYESEVTRKDGKLNRDGMKLHLERVELLILLPGNVSAYALRNRKWFEADVELLEPVVHDNGWNDLVLPSGHKELIQAMVENHAVGASASKDGLGLKTEADLVRGKGKHFVLLQIK
ncbi:hypothetical protein F4810DRAFT_703512 [Camillea tinctor]|nr:hypothetical protein F4810DRAFT_703512 [Camillea tinctor]